MPQPLDKTALDNLARDLRAAVLAVNHEKATRVTLEYSEALRQYWMALSGDERAASSIPQQSRELLNWVREMTLMQQAMTAAQLAMVEKAGRALAARSVYLETAALGRER
jgi:hypothetical protein